MTQDPRTQPDPAPPASIEPASLGPEPTGSAAVEPAAPVLRGPDAPSAGDGTADGDAPRPLPVEGTGPRIHLDQFEGPLDLLLFLIREEEMEITDIPIARITDQYLATVGDLDALDLDKAGEYLVMATTLMRIKAKMLIPRDADDDEDEDDEDPRAELVRRLLEYREFKRVAEGLGERQDEWRSIFSRAGSPIPEVEGGDDELEDLGVSLVDLFRAFREIVVRAVPETPLHMQTEEYSVEECIDVIRGAVELKADGVPFGSLFRDLKDRNRVITTFLALLEMIRQREIVARQVERFGEIWLKSSATEETAAT